MTDSAEQNEEMNRKPGQKPGAEGGEESPAKDTLPGLPADDDSPLGDTDQHSDA